VARGGAAAAGFGVSGWGAWVVRLGRAERGGRSRRTGRGWEAGGQELVGVGRCWRGRASVGFRWFWCLGSGAGGGGAAICSVGGGGREAAVARAESLLGVRGLGQAPAAAATGHPPSCAPSSRVAAPAGLTDSPAAPFGGTGPRRGGRFGSCGPLYCRGLWPSASLRSPPAAALVGPSSGGRLPAAAGSECDWRAARARGPAPLGREWRLPAVGAWAPVGLCASRSLRSGSARGAALGVRFVRLLAPVPPLSITDPPPRGRRRTR
jgi:hypothetical protein